MKKALTKQAPITAEAHALAKRASLEAGQTFGRFASAAVIASARRTMRRIGKRKPVRAKKK